MQQNSAQPADQSADEGYSTQKVAELVGMAPKQVRHYVRRNLVAPQRGAKGEYRFGFQDVVLLRTARSLLDSGISPRGLFRALARLKAGADPETVLSAVRIHAQGGAVVVRSEDQVWDAETGQGCLQLEPSAATVADSDAVQPMWTYLNEDSGDGDDLSSDEWRQLGVDLEELDVAKAFEAYGRALEADPGNADAHVNIGRLYQLKGNLKGAKRHYELAVQAAPKHQLALYNLGTLFDEINEPALAAAYYHKAPKVPDAHHNLARIARRQGDELAYRRHHQQYQRLLQKEGREH